MNECSSDHEGPQSFCQFHSRAPVMQWISTYSMGTAVSFRGAGRRQRWVPEQTCQHHDESVSCASLLRPQAISILASLFNHRTALPLQHKTVVSVEFRKNPCKMQTILQSHVQTGLTSNAARSHLDASRAGCVSLPLRRQFLSGSRLTCSRHQQKQNAHGRRAGAVSVRAEKVRKT